MKPLSIYLSCFCLYFVTGSWSFDLWQANLVLLLLLLLLINRDSWCTIAYTGHYYTLKLWECHRERERERERAAVASKSNRNCNQRLYFIRLAASWCHVHVLHALCMHLPRCRGGRLNRNSNSGPLGATSTNSASPSAPKKKKQKVSYISNCMKRPVRLFSSTIV